MLVKVTLNGLAGLVVAHGPPVAHPCSKLSIIHLLTLLIIIINIIILILYIINTLLITHY